MPRKSKIKEKTDEELEVKKSKVKFPQLLRGMKDILPSEQKYWDFIYSKVFKIAQDYGFEKIDTPILEETSLFVRSVGKETDIVEKEMFSFVDKGGENISLRPELTAPIARAYIEHGMVNLPQPIKLFYWGPMFRHERPQAGRYRQAHQFGFEILGSLHPVLDTQLILLTSILYEELGVDFTIQINNLGCPNCRPDYIQLLRDYYSTRKRFLCNNCKKRFQSNPLRLLDCKEGGCRELANQAPQIVDHLCEDCRGHFVKVLEYLDEAEVSYNLNPRVVRGLDYYTRTTFEIWTSEIRDHQTELGGGGRYDNLIKELGGRPTPALGFAGGIERIISRIKEKEIFIPEKEKPDVFLAQLGESARKKSLRLLENLRKEGIRVTESLSQDGLKNQLFLASKLGIRFTLILGQKEIIDKTILLRDMEDGSQEIIDFRKIGEEIKKRLVKKSKKFIEEEDKIEEKK